MAKRILYALLILFMGIASSCSEDETEQRGNIYGIVTDSKTAEPMRAVGVELYSYGSLLLKSVTYDDGHYEFEDLVPAEYGLKVVAEGYSDVEYSVLVEGGRTARADMQVSPLLTNMIVKTYAIGDPVNDVITLNGYFSNNSGYYPQEAGFVYGQSQNINQDNGTIIKSSTYYNDFSAKLNIKELSRGTWYVKAYAKNKIGYEFGEIRKFEVNLVPVVKTLAVTNVEETNATLNGLIVYEGKPKYTEKGFVYSSSFNNPTIDDQGKSTVKVAVSGDSKEFGANVSDLTKDTKYYVRSYVIYGDKKVVYGEPVSFTPQSQKPEVKTLSATNVGATSATLNGLIVNEGNPKYTEKGFVYSSSFNLPTIDDPENAASKVAVSGNSKEFSANVSNLIEDKTYYARAYAKYGDGVVYGDATSFEAKGDKPYIIIDNLAIQLTDLSTGTRWDIADELCKKSTVGGFTDWRLPTLVELTLMYENRDKIGGFSTSYSASKYWSSSESSSGHYYLYFSDGSSYSSSQNGYTCRVRAVRTVK